MEICHAFGVTLTALSNPQVRALLDRPGGARRLPPPTQLRLGGSAVSRELRYEIGARLTPDVYVTYATTETGSVATAGPGLHELHPHVVGEIREGVMVEIVDEDGREVSVGTVGEIRIKSRAAANTYYDDPEAAKRAFRGGWFYPGDRGWIAEGRYLCFEGRADEMFNFATINIFPSEIENVVGAFPGVVECAAFSTKSPDFGDIPLIAVVARDSVTADEILTEARSALGLRAPRKVFLMDALPRTSAGKVARGELGRLARVVR